MFLKNKIIDYLEDVGFPMPNEDMLKSKTMWILTGLVTLFGALVFAVSFNMCLMVGNAVMSPLVLFAYALVLLLIYVYLGANVARKLLKDEGAPWTNMIYMFAPLALISLLFAITLGLLFFFEVLVAMTITWSMLVPFLVGGFASAKMIDDDSHRGSAEDYVQSLEDETFNEAEVFEEQESNEESENTKGAEADTEVNPFAEVGEPDLPPALKRPRVNDRKQLWVGYVNQQVSLGIYPAPENELKNKEDFINFVRLQEDV